MRIKTNFLGVEQTIEVAEEQIFAFEPGIGGFDGLRRYALIAEEDSAVEWLQSVDREDVCFLVADPRPFFPDYQLKLRASDLGDLDIGDEDDTAVAVVLNIPLDASQATANLLAPIVFNTRRRLARQIILEGSRHPVRAPLFQEESRVCQAG